MPKWIRPAFEAGLYLSACGIGDQQPSQTEEHYFFTCKCCSQINENKKLRQAIYSVIAYVGSSKHGRITGYRSKMADLIRIR